MIKLYVRGDMVIGLIELAQDYTPKKDDILVDELPHVELKENERAYLYYRNGKIEYEIKEI